MIGCPRETPSNPIKSSYVTQKRKKLKYTIKQVIALY